jgi:hypothetical protein
MYAITGFLHPIDAMAIAGLGAWQGAAGITGSIMEIGVFYGRSFALMAKFLDPSKEVAIACDLFDIDGITNDDSLQLRSFKSLLKHERIHESSVRIIKGDSSKLKPKELLNMAGPIRFLSIDGSHEEHHVSGDAELALRILSGDGFIFFDDFFNHQYPGVTMAIMRILETWKSEVAPFLITKNKLFVCRRRQIHAYRAAATELPLWAGAEREQCRFNDDTIVCLFQSLPDRAIYQFMARFGLGSLGCTMLGIRPRRFFG